MKDENSKSNCCVDCLPDKVVHDFNLFDTGICCFCSKLNEVIDVELISLYVGIGFDSEFILGHLPRLRKNLTVELTMKDIGSEISRHIIYGNCGSYSCQGYALESRSKSQFKI